MMLAAACLVPAAAGALQALAGAWLVRRFAARLTASPSGHLTDPLPAISVLKPLCGDEPMLETALASICTQDYPALQIVFGVQDPADPALAVLERLRARFPGVDMAVVVNAARHGENRKVSNLINMFPAARHGVIVIGDSDVHAPPGWLRAVAAALARPGTGLATTLYTGLPASPALPARLGAAQINYGFLPGAALSRALGRQDCLGATMALRRETLAAIGGLAALKDDLADDNRLGVLVRARGEAVALAATVPATTVPEARFSALWRHELRWARTIRAIVPGQFAASALQYPVFWASLAAILAGGAGWALAGLAIAFAARAVAARTIDRALRLTPAAPIWLLPARDLLSIAVLIASYFGDRVEWRGQTLHAGAPASRKG